MFYILCIANEILSQYGNTGCRVFKGGIQNHIAGLDIFFVQIYMDALLGFLGFPGVPGVPGVSKN